MTTLENIALQKNQRKKKTSTEKIADRLEELGVERKEFISKFLGCCKDKCILCFQDAESYFNDIKKMKKESKMTNAKFLNEIELLSQKCEVANSELSSKIENLHVVEDEKNKINILLENKNYDNKKLEERCTEYFLQIEMLNKENEQLKNDAILQEERIVFYKEENENLIMENDKLSGQYLRLKNKKSENMESSFQRSCTTPDAMEIEHDKKTDSTRSSVQRKTTPLKRFSDGSIKLTTDCDVKENNQQSAKLDETTLLRNVKSEILDIEPKPFSFDDNCSQENNTCQQNSEDLDISYENSEFDQECPQALKEICNEATDALSVMHGIKKLQSR